MMPSSNLALVGVGGTGCAAALAVARAYGPSVRLVATDTDASTGEAFAAGEFVLLGGDRLAGRGAGGRTALARAAVQDNPGFLDDHLEGVRTVVVLTALGGGTGGGATPEIVRHFNRIGIVSVVFATIPFAFEGAARLSSARSAEGAIADCAGAFAVLPLDDLVRGVDEMKRALAAAAESLASGVTLFWRVIDRPGYIKFDAERLRGLLSGAGRARFAVASASEGDRVMKILSSLRSGRLLDAGAGSRSVRTAVVGILAGDDLRLSEVGGITEGVKAAFAQDAVVEMGTVNDEEAFSGSITTVVMLFEERATPKHSNNMDEGKLPISGERGLGMQHNAFRNSESTIWRGENLDIPTYLRRNLTLER